jgi:hypothetical protein
LKKEHGDPPSISCYPRYQVADLLLRHARSLEAERPRINEARRLTTCGDSAFVKQGYLITPAFIDHPADRQF